MSPRTKQVKKLKNVFCIISYVLWIGTILFLVATVFGKIADSGKQGAVEEADKAIEIMLSAELKNLILSISTTAIIGILASIIIKDKIRTFIWMLSVILSTILFKEVGMYIVLSIWFIEEYVVHALYIHYKNLLTINKEIDRR